MKTMPQFVLSGIVLLAGCDDGNPIVLASTDVASPDGKSLAVVERVDNGLGIGLGMVYDEVHVGPSDMRIVGHGDFDAYVVFYAAQESSASTSLEVIWVNSDHLRIVHDPLQKPARPFQQVGRIKVECIPRAAT